MNNDVEGQLRQAMIRFTADLRAPSGMVRRAERRQRRRRLARRSVTAAALGAVAVAVVAVLVPGVHRGRTERPPIDVAYVTKRVDSALGRTGPAAIAQMTITSNALGATITAEEWSYGDQWRSVVSQSGRRLYDAGGTGSAGLLVSYSARVWARQSGAGGSGPPASRAGGCRQAAAALSALFRVGVPSLGSASGAAPASVVKVLRAAISCGSLTVAGHRTVDGIKATELRSTKNSLIAETVWVSSVTYLPVRVVVRPAAGSPFSARTADIRWLEPTARNRARLTVPIPAGFRRVPFRQAVTPISP